MNDKNKLLASIILLSLSTNKKPEQMKVDAKQQLNDLLTEFDEMGYSPTTLCKNPEENAKEWKACLVCVIGKIERQARKKTAKEILQRLYDKCYEYNPRLAKKYREHIIPVEILQFAKDYGVDIEE